jgi:hypothetical protein
MVDGNAVRLGKISDHLDRLTRILHPLVLSGARSAESKDEITVEMRPSTSGSLRDPSAQDERI